MIVVPLGVASATPTATRHLPAVALWREGSVFLFDCGENTQMRMLQAGIKRSKLECIFISHLDIDHFSGIVGLLSTLQLQRREKSLKIVGPAGIQDYVEWNLNFAKIEIGYEIIFIEVAEDTDEAVVIDEEEYFVTARALKHTKFCLGYRFQEKDKPGKVNAVLAEELGIVEDTHFKALKAGEDVTLDDGSVVKSSDVVGHPRPGDSFAYISDTTYCPNAVRLAMNTNILYHEATFSNELADKAVETGHSTAGDAARVATESQTKLLVIGHFSARYTNPHLLLNEAREGFYPTWLAQELRPIFTDPVHERGIVKPKVELRDLTKLKTGGKRPRYDNRSHDSRRSHSHSGKVFRSRRDDSRGRYSSGPGGHRSSDSGRKSYYNKDSGRPGSYRSGSDSGGYRSRSGSDTYRRRSDERNDYNQGNNPKNFRSSYDDQDRF